MKLPSKLKSIGACAFWGCKELEIDVLNEDIDIGKDAFRNVKSIEVKTGSWKKL